MGALAACHRGGLRPAIVPVDPPPGMETPRSAPLPDAVSALAARGLMVPVDGVKPGDFSDTFLASRGDRNHNAIDIMAPRGTKVVVADSGTVWKVRSNNLGGLTVYVLDHEERFVYYYAHLDGYRRGLKEGERVAQGAVIGYVGSTGNAPEHIPHLHFQVLIYRCNGRWWDGDPINPHQFLARPGKALRE